LAAQHWIYHLFEFTRDSTLPFSRSVQFHPLFADRSQNLISALGHQQHIFDPETDTFLADGFQVQRL